jgi:hypothetical protein
MLQMGVHTHLITCRAAIPLMGSRPDCWGYLAAYGWDRDDGEGVDKFR